MINAPVFKELVLLGGGHSHVEVLRQFGMEELPGARITLISRDVQTPYSGMLPGHVAGHYTFDDIHIDLGPLSRFAGARFYRDEAVGLDPARRLVHCRNRPPVRYDVLSIDTGATPDLGVPGAAGVVVPVKPINGFLEHWDKLRARTLASTGKTRIGVVGAGAGGVEILLAIRFRLRELLAAAGRSAEDLEFHLFGAAADLMPTHNRLARATFRRVLARRDVHIHFSCPIDRVEPGRVWSGANAFALDEILWVTEAAAPDWPKAAGLAVDESGFIQVGRCLRSLSHPEIFAAGDVATMVGQERPKAGVYAVRQGPPLARNLRRALQDQPLRPLRLQRHALALVSTGERYAVASRGALFARGRWLWRIKDRIDRRFMRRYSDLPDMPRQAAAPIAPGIANAAERDEFSAGIARCGGCGAKIGASVLVSALADLRPLERPDVLVGLAARDDAAVVAVPVGKVMVHSVDYFRAFIDDPYVFGRIAANHALGDIFAMNAAPQTALAIATLRYGPERQMKDTLQAVMTGALATLNDCGASLVGGHSSEGAELALGLAVNGLADAAGLAKKSGMRPGERLILTKPIGTGTLLAADMRRKAKGSWIDAALATMLVSSHDAARILFEHGATACTDVTGFGLVGHLLEMVRASQVGVELDFDAVPILDGAIETARLGILSSLYSQNARFAGEIRNFDSAATNARCSLLFDPQTAGGLLASVPAENAALCLAALRQVYPQAAIIGTVQPQDGGGAPVRLRVPQ